MGFLRQAAFILAFGSAVTILFSIAISQIMLALALAAVLLSGLPLRFPPIRTPLALFFLLTVVSLLDSGDPLSGTPQIRKFFIFAILLVISTTFESVGQARAVVLAWAGIATLSAFVGFHQFVQRRMQENTYEYILDGRITGFASHWMTFGGEE